MRWIDVGFAPDPESSDDDAPDDALVAAGWALTAWASSSLRVFRVRARRECGGVACVVADARLALARAVACWRDVACVVTADGWMCVTNAAGGAATWTRASGTRADGFDASAQGRRAVMLANGCAMEVAMEVHRDADFTLSLRRLETPRAVTRVACGANHFAFVDEVGRAWTCGENAYGQCGLGRANVEGEPTPTLVESFSRADVAIVDASCGDAFTVFLSADSAPYACGTNASGQLGTEDCAVGDASATPLLIDLDARVRRVVCGARHAVALDDDGVLHAWGADDFGQCGARDAPRDVPGVVRRPTRLELHGQVVAVACGAQHVSALVAVASAARTPPSRAPTRPG